MNNYTFEEINIGLKESFEFEINEEKMNLFLSISNDINPLHNDIVFAKKEGYQEKVVYGMLTASCLSTLAGVYIPGKRSLIESVDIKFIKPVFVSSSPLLVEGEVIEKDDRFKRIILKYNIYDNKKNKVSRGKMTIGFLKGE